MKRYLNILFYKLHLAHCILLLSHGEKFWTRTRSRGEDLENNCSKKWLHKCMSCIGEKAKKNRTSTLMNCSRNVLSVIVGRAENWNVKIVNTIQQRKSLAVLPIKVCSV